MKPGFFRQGLGRQGLGRLCCIVGIMASAITLSAPTFPVLASETSDFQIVKATDTVAWRLNRKTGEIAVCKLDGDTMICSSSTTAVTKGQESYDAYKADKENSEKSRQAHEMAVLDRVMAFFKSMITLMMGNSGS